MTEKRNKKLDLYEEIENLKNENVALKRSVESKIAAIGILRSELQSCQNERDKFQMIAETQYISPQVNLTASQNSPRSVTKNTSYVSNSQDVLVQLLSQSKDEVKSLKQEITELKCKLHDAQSDLKILRSEKVRKSVPHQNRNVGRGSQLPHQERMSFIEQLEIFSTKCQNLELDLRCVLDEREELIKERDASRHKLHRLNHILNVTLSRSERRNSAHGCHVVDLDAVIAENRYLQQRVKHLDEEKKLVLDASKKYKTALDVCRSSSRSTKIRSTGGQLVISHKQVAELLDQHELSLDDHSKKEPLRNLCTALLDSLNQKNKLIKSQKSANRLLMARLEDLEERFSKSEIDTDDTANMAPISSLLMEGYKPSCSRSSSTQIEDESLNVNTPLHEEDEGIESTIPNTSSSGASDKTEDNVEREPESQKGPLKMEEQTDDVQNSSSPDVKESETPSQALLNGSEPSSDTEEIVPLEKLDDYISKLKLKTTANAAHSPEDAKNEVTSPEPTSSDSFDLDISDYDSDNLDETLQNWQKDFKNTSPKKFLEKLKRK